MASWREDPIKGSVTMRAKLGAFVLGLLLAMAFVSTAHASNVVQPSLDAAASRIAGKPVTVHCENDAAQWAAMVADSHPGIDPRRISGFTRMISTTIIYIDPRSCAAVSSPESVLSFELAYGFLTLAHEAVHQSGVRDETETDCQALALVKPLLLELGISASKSVVKTVLVRIRLKTGMYVRRAVKRTYVVVNPLLAQVQAAAVAIHDQRPANYKTREC